MPVKRILAIDPGLTIGWCAAEYDTDKKIYIVDLGQEKLNKETWDPFMSKPYQLIEWCDIMTIEDFVGAGYRTTESCFVLKMIGAFLLRARQLGKEYNERTPGSRYPFMNKAKKFVNIWEPERKLVHATDAVSHAFRETKEKGENLEDFEIVRHQFISEITACPSKD